MTQSQAKGVFMAGRIAAIEGAIAGDPIVRKVVDQGGHVYAVSMVTEEGEGLTFANVRLRLENIPYIRSVYIAKELTVRSIY